MPKMSQAKRQRLKRKREKLATEQAQQDSAAQDASVSASNVRLGSGDDCDGKYGPTGYMPASTEAKMLERAVRNGWLEEDNTQRFETRTSENVLAERVSSAPGEGSAMELASLELIKSLKSPNRRTTMIAIRALIQMEAANQRDEQHAEDLKIKQAVLEQKGGHVDNSIPTGVVILERPCVTEEEFHEELRRAQAEEEEEEEEEACNGAVELPVPSV